MTMLMRFPLLLQVSSTDDKVYHLGLGYIMQRLKICFWEKIWFWFPDLYKSTNGDQGGAMV